MYPRSRTLNRNFVGFTNCYRKHKNIFEKNCLFYDQFKENAQEKSARQETVMKIANKKRSSKRIASNETGSIQKTSKIKKPDSSPTINERFQEIKTDVPSSKYFANNKVT